MARRKPPKGKPAKRKPAEDQFPFPEPKTSFLFTRFSVVAFETYPVEGFSFPDDEITFSFDMEPEFDEETDEIIIHLTVNAQTEIDGERHLLGKISTDSTFMIEEFDDLTDEELEFEMTTHLITFVHLAISTTRGALVVKGGDGILGQVVIPPIDLLDLISDLPDF